MSCLSEDISVKFRESNIEIRPFGTNIRQSLRDQFGSCRIRITPEAGNVIDDNGIIQEPVDVMFGNQNLYHGFLDYDSVKHGESTSHLHVADPIRILRYGSVDNEWQRANAREVVEYAFERRNDPYNVLTDVIVGPDDSEIHGKYEETGWADKVGGGENNRSILDYSDVGSEWEARQEQRIEDWFRGWVPFSSQDEARFEYREATPYEAIYEVSNLWQVPITTLPDGTLVLKSEVVDPKIFSMGVDDNMFRVSDYHIPEARAPIQGVIVKGSTKNDGWNDRAYDLVADNPRLETRAAAWFPGRSDGRIVMVEKRDITSADELRVVAQQTLLSHLVSENSGNAKIDVLSSRIPEVEWLEMMQPSDFMAVAMDHHDCLNVQDGLYEIDRVDHRIDGNRGWMIDIGLSLSITDLLDDAVQTSFWKYDPSDPSHTEDAPIEVPE